MRENFEVETKELVVGKRKKCKDFKKKKKEVVCDVRVYKC